MLNEMEKQVLLFKGNGVPEEIAWAEVSKGNQYISEAVWDTKYINDLPDIAFAYIEPGGEKDDEGKTKPRSLRHLPHHNKSVKSATENDSVDLPHLRNALARLPQTKISAEGKAKAKAHLLKHAKVLLPSYKDDEEMLSYFLSEQWIEDNIPLNYIFREINSLKKFDTDGEFKIYTIDLSEGIKVIVGPNKKKETISVSDWIFSRDVEVKRSIRGFLFEKEKWTEEKINKFLLEEWKIEIEEDVNCTKSKYYSLQSNTKILEGTVNLDLIPVEDGKYKEDDDWIYVKGMANVEEISRNGPFVITKDSFKEAIPGYMENPKIFFQHQQTGIMPEGNNETKYSIGLAVEAGVNELGPWIIAKISKDSKITPEGVIERIKKGLIHTFSVGLLALSEEYVCANKNACFLLIDKIDWLETSIVEIPASKHSHFTIIENLPEGSRLNSFVKYGLGHLPKGPGPLVVNESITPRDIGISIVEEKKMDENEVNELQQDLSKLEEGYKTQIKMTEEEKLKLQAEKEELLRTKKELEEKVRMMEEEIRKKKVEQEIKGLIDGGYILPADQEAWFGFMMKLSEEDRKTMKELLEKRKVLDMQESIPENETENRTKTAIIFENDPMEKPEEKREKIAKAILEGGL